jgi:hypothetical protein
MIKRIPPFALLTFVFILALTACSTVKTNVDNGPITARTFSFLNTGPKPAPNFADKTPQAHEAIQNAILHSLAAKGVKYVATGGDITVAYLIIVGDNASTTSINDYFGYTEDANAILEKTHKAQTVTSDQRGYFETGTLVIDFVNPANSTVLQRRTIQAEILRNLALEQRAARVQGLVNQELSNLAIKN